MSVCGEGALSGGGAGVGAGAGELAAVVARLAGEEPPLLWAGPAAADCARVRDAVRFAALEINEHLETYFDRRDHALEVRTMLFCNLHDDERRSIICNLNSRC